MHEIEFKSIRRYLRLLTLIGCGIIVALLQGCAPRHYNDYRLDLRLKDYNQLEAKTIIDSAFYALRKLETCDYLKTWHPKKHGKLLRLIKGRITVENYSQPNFDKSCGRAHLFGRDFKMNGDKLFSTSSCSATDHTFAHEVLHLCGFPHGVELNTVLYECGVPLPEKFRKTPKKFFNR